MVRLAVIQQGGEWRIICPQAKLDTFPTRALALSAGARLASQLHDTGAAVELIVQDAIGNLTRHPLDEAPRATGVVLNFREAGRI